MSKQITITIVPTSTCRWGEVRIGGAKMELPYSIAMRIDKIIRPLIYQDQGSEGILQKLEREAISRAVLNKNGESYDEIANRLGITKRTLSEKRKKFNLP